jgi:hypothetical protein
MTAMTDDTGVAKTYVDGLFERFVSTTPFLQHSESAWQQFAAETGAPITFTSHNYQALLRRYEILASEKQTLAMALQQHQQEASCAAAAAAMHLETLTREHSGKLAEQQQKFEATTTQLRHELDSVTAQWTDGRQQLENFAAETSHLHLEELRCATNASNEVIIELQRQVTELEADRGYTDRAHKAAEASSAMQAEHNAQLAELHLSHKAELLRQQQQHKKEASYADTAAEIRVEKLAKEHTRQLANQQQAHGSQMQMRLALHDLVTAQLRRRLAKSATGCEGRVQQLEKLLLAAQSETLRLEQLLCAVTDGRDACLAELERQSAELQSERAHRTAEAVSVLMLSHCTCKRALQNVCIDALLQVVLLMMYTQQLSV